MHISFQNLTGQWQQLNVLYPTQQWNGRAGTVAAYGDSKPDVYNCRCRFAVEQLCNRFYTTMEQAERAATRWMQQEVQRKCPLVLHEDLVLFRVRCDGGGKKDQGLAYVVWNRVTHVESLGERLTRLTFLDGSTFWAGQSQRSVMRNMNLCEVLLAQYRREMYLPGNEIHRITPTERM